MSTAPCKVSRLLSLPGGRYAGRLVCDSESSQCRLVVTSTAAADDYSLPFACSFQTSLPHCYAGAAILRRGCGTGLSRLVALVLCPTGVAVLALPTEEALGGHCQAGGSRRLRSAQVHPVVLGYGMHPAVDARWHPWSDRHFVTLSEDGLRTWDAAAALGDAGAAAGPVGELLFPRHGQQRLSSPPAALAWGRGPGWDSLCAYIACQDSALYVVCPLLPPGIELPVAVVETLRHAAAQAAQAAAAQPPHYAAASAASAAAAAAPASRQAATTLHWLSYFRPIAGGVLAFCPPTVDPRDLAHLHSAIEALDAAGYAQPFPHVPALQGPIPILPRQQHPSSSQHAAPLCDALVLSPEASPHHTLLAMLCADGKLTLALAPEPVRPLWGDLPAAAAVQRGKGELALSSSSSSLQQRQPQFNGRSSSSSSSSSFSFSRASVSPMRTSTSSHSHSQSSSSRAQLAVRSPALLAPPPFASPHHLPAMAAAATGPCFGSCPTLPLGGWGAGAGAGSSSSSSGSGSGSGSSSGGGVSSRDYEEDGGEEDSSTGSDSSAPWLAVAAWDLQLGSPYAAAADRHRIGRGLYSGGGAGEGLGRQGLEPEALQVPWLCDGGWGKAESMAGSLGGGGGGAAQAAQGAAAAGAAAAAAVAAAAATAAAECVAGEDGAGASAAAAAQAAQSAAAAAAAATAPPPASPSACLLLLVAPTTLHAITLPAARLAHLSAHLASALAAGSSSSSSATLLPHRPALEPLPLYATRLIGPSRDSLPDLVGVDVCPERDMLVAWVCDYGQAGGVEEGEEEEEGGRAGSSSSRRQRRSLSHSASSHSTALTGHLVTRSIPMACLACQSPELAAQLGSSSGSSSSSSSSPAAALTASLILSPSTPVALVQALFFSLPSVHDQLLAPSAAAADYMQELLARKAGELSPPGSGALRLGDYRAMAECWGEVARHKDKMGELEEALGVREALCARLKEDVVGRLGRLRAREGAVRERVEGVAARLAAAAAAAAAAAGSGGAGEQEGLRARAAALDARSRALTQRLHTLFFSLAMRRAEEVDARSRGAGAGSGRLYRPAELKAATWTEQAAFDRLHDILNRQVRPLARLDAGRGVGVLREGGVLQAALQLVEQFKGEGRLQAGESEEDIMDMLRRSGV